PSPAGALGLELRDLQRRRMAELAELRGVAREQQVDGPVDDQPQPSLDSGHREHVVGPGEEPGREAAPLDPQRAGDRRVLPAVQATVRVGTVSPVESLTLRSVTSSIVVLVRISIPRPRSSRAANSARSGWISCMMRSLASTRTQRMPWTRQRG